MATLQAEELYLQRVNALYQLVGDALQQRRYGNTDQYQLVLAQSRTMTEAGFHPIPVQNLRIERNGELYAELEPASIATVGGDGMIYLKGRVARLTLLYLRSNRQIYTNVYQWPPQTIPAPHDGWYWFPFNRDEPILVSADNFWKMLEEASE